MGTPRADSRMIPRSSLRLVLATVTLLLACTAAAADRVDVDQVMHDFGISADAAARIRSGEMVESDPTESSERELAVGLTFLVQQPIANVLEAFRSAVDLKADRQLRAAVVMHGAPKRFHPPRTAIGRSETLSRGASRRHAQSLCSMRSAPSMRWRRRGAPPSRTSSGSCSPCCSTDTALIWPTGSMAWLHTRAAAARAIHLTSCGRPPKRPSLLNQLCARALAVAAFVSTWKAGGARRAVLLAPL